MRVGDVSVVVEDGVAWLPDKSTFAGSVSSMYSMFVRLVTDWDVRIEDAVAMTSRNQARLLNMDDHVGSIETGKLADLVLLDEDFKIVEVLKSGAPVLQASRDSCG